MEPEGSLPYSQVPATCPYPEPVWTAAAPGFDPRTVQPVASRYTDWATWPTHFMFNGLILEIMLFMR
jgi:hypothetical protein